MRTPIYPAVEEFIRSKKQVNYAKLQEESSDTDTSKKSIGKRLYKYEIKQNNSNYLQAKKEKILPKRNKRKAYQKEVEQLLLQTQLCWFVVPAKLKVILQREANSAKTIISL